MGIGDRDEKLEHRDQGIPRSDRGQLGGPLWEHERCQVTWEVVEFGGESDGRKCVSLVHRFKS